MRRRLGLIALVVALLAAAPALASESKPSLGELEGEVMCPTCKTTLNMSSAPIAERMRRFIAGRIEAGDTKSEIKRRLVSEFGQNVLAEPSKKGFNLLAWLLPIVGILLAAVVLGWLAWRWSRGRAGGGAGGGSEAPEPPLDPAVEQRLDEELARFEA